MVVGIMILTETEVLCFLNHWKFRPGPPISAVGNQQKLKFTTFPVHLADGCNSSCPLRQS